ncbi:myb-like protein V isoform X2 [Drosophila willistoni]|uniref:myb-like protein V isoform X2 n=1 Tax=Drosophila willistoni TaxID=7260 RepID=UPI000C26C8E7|nr:myb-like protein V isoform X2 [Drosophila willistoni]
MWEQIINCLTKGGSGNSKKCQFLNLSELYKRCPPNQRKQFALFKKKNEEYKERLQKYPDSMPKIDWKYYETSVRPEYVAWVKRFQNQYEQFDTFFENRHTLIDPSKYFCEVQEEMKEVTKQVEQYKKESNERIKCLEDELKFLGELKPYQEMTMEEFCYAKPSLAPDFINKPTFWPHTPEEQKPGPQQEVHEEAEEELQATKVKPTDEEPPKTAPPAAGTPKTSTDEKPSKAPTSSTDQKHEAKKDPQPQIDTKNDSKADSGTKVDQVSCEGETKTKDQQPENPIDVEKLKESASELAVKGSKLAVDLAKKASILLKSLVEKFNAKRKEIEVAANKAREENKGKSEQQAVEQVSSTDVSKATVDPKEVDSIYYREGSKNICHQTIIKGDDEANAEVKPKHANLNEEVEGEGEEVVEETEKRFKKKSAALKTNDSEAMEEKTKSESIEPQKTREKSKTSKSSETKNICQQVCEIMTKEKPPGKGSEAIQCLEKILTDYKQSDEGPCDSEKEEEPSENEDSKKSKCLTKTKQDQKSKEKPKVDEQQCFQKFLEENSKKCDESQTNLKKSWEESKDSVDVVARPKDASKTKPTDDAKTNEKALFGSDFQTEALESKTFMGFKSNEPHASKKDEKHLASLEDSAEKMSNKETTGDLVKPIYAGTNQTHDLENDLAESQKKDKLHLIEEFEQKQAEEAKLKQVENETKRKTEETMKKPTNLDNLSLAPNEKSQSKTEIEAEKVAEPKTTFYPKLVISAKPKEKINTLESPTEKPPTPPAKDTPSTPEAFIPRTSTTPVPPSTPPKVIKTPEVLESAQEMAKKVFKMATDAAAILSDATTAVESAKKAKTNRIESLEAAYLAAQKQANRALTEAYKAMGAAKKLTKRQQNRDPDALVMAEKHAVLAKLLARRAIALKKEIETILEELKKNQ